MVTGGMSVLPKPLAHAEQSNTSYTEQEMFFIEDTSITNQLYEEYKRGQEKKAVSKTSQGSSVYACSCVLYLRYGLNIPIPPVGQAKNLVPNIKTPVAGAVVITRESSYGHVAYIERLSDEGLEVVEGNYYRCKVSRRTIPYDSKIIIGYWQT